MTRWSVIALVLAAFAVANVRAAEREEETRARKAALDLAGAFSNEGFKMRDGHWVGSITPQQRTVVAVNLYAGNQYWFSAGAADESKKITVELFDETGRQLPSDSYASGGAAAAGISPTSSGQYFIALGVDGAPTTCCVLYSYK